MFVCETNREGSIPPFTPNKITRGELVWSFQRLPEEQENRVRFLDRAPNNEYALKQYSVEITRLTLNQESLV